MDLDSVPRGTETILVVDDEEHVRATICTILEELGYQTLQAEDPGQAVRLARLSKIDLLLVDVILPMMSGLELAHSISTIRPATKVLYMSGFTADEVLGDREGQHSLMGFLDKPFSAMDLGTKVRELLDSAFPKPLPRGAGDEESETIMVVDDDPAMRQIIARLLERLGYEVVSAANPDEAVRLVLQHDICLIVMDVILPRLNGLALAHTISALRPGIRMLYVSGYSQEELTGQFGIPDLGVAFLKKPFNPDGMGNLIRGLLDELWEREPYVDFH